MPPDTHGPGQQDQVTGSAAARVGPNATGANGSEPHTYSATRHPMVSPNTRDGCINVGGYFEVSPPSARALAAALVRAAEAQEAMTSGD